MKRFFYFMPLALSLWAALLSSCDRLGDASSSGTGRLNLAFVKGGELLTRSYLNLPDTSDFILTVSDASGAILYKGKYGDCPESVEVKAGSYNVKVVSSEFDKPAFDAPQFGDEQCVLVKAGAVASVRLMCTQINAGVKLDIAPGFLTQCPDASLFLKSTHGKLMYSYSERRTAYFLPGAVSLVMSSGAVDQVLMVRDVAAREMINIGVSVPEKLQEGKSGVSIAVDTSRVWISEECVIGSNASGSDAGDALTVAEARTLAGSKDVWVCGYVVGGDLTSASASYDLPFESRTNILLGPKSSTRDKKVCLSVQLPDGELREKLNLVDNPSLLGKKISVKGDIVSAYYGIPGIKNPVVFQQL